VTPLWLRGAGRRLESVGHGDVTRWRRVDGALAQPTLPWAKGPGRGAQRRRQPPPPPGPKAASTRSSALGCRAPPPRPDPPPARRPLCRRRPPIFCAAPQGRPSTLFALAARGAAAAVAAAAAARAPSLSGSRAPPCAPSPPWWQGGPGAPAPPWGRSLGVGAVPPPNCLPRGKAGPLRPSCPRPSWPRAPTQRGRGRRCSAASAPRGAGAWRGVAGPGAPRSPVYSLPPARPYTARCRSKAPDMYAPGVPSPRNSRLKNPLERAAAGQPKQAHWPLAHLIRAPRALRHSAILFPLRPPSRPSPIHLGAHFIRRHGKALPTPGPRTCRLLP
jgi:hypothetical protein